VRATITLICGAGLLAGSFIPSTVYSAVVNNELASIKAAYVFNFSKLVDWPDEDLKETNPLLHLCVLGSDSEVFKKLSEYSGQRVNNREVNTKHYFDLRYANRCDVLYISRSEYPILQQVFDRVSGLPILTISDIPNFIIQGGMLGLQLEGSQIQFTANQQCAKLARLKISSDLLALARNRRNASELDCR